MYYSITSLCSSGLVPYRRWGLLDWVDVNLSFSYKLMQDDLYYVWLLCRVLLPVQVTWDAPNCTVRFHVSNPPLLL